ncbi:MAG: hypothetical protein PHR26_04185 [Candidatus ainarchaeum sp.]|nr:hypothetical protein [Candidatus ainarchaeum sp.]MDD3976443.1 hypothetical protein [Candidatus ainarchaeum sp.]
MIKIHDQKVSEKTGIDYLNWKINDLQLSILKLENNLKFKKKLLKEYKQKK